MNKVLRVFRHEFITLVSRFSFWLALLGVPLAAFIVFGVAVGLRAGQAESDVPNTLEEVAQLFAPPELEPALLGYIDDAGLLAQFSADFPGEDWIAFSTEPEARQALEAGRLHAYYRIPPDYLESGRLLAVMRTYDISEARQRAEPLVRQIKLNLLDGELELAKAVEEPLAIVIEENLAPPEKPARSIYDLTTVAVPYAMMSVIFIAVMGSSSLMLNSLAYEKENRVLEVLILSTSPQQFLLGKIAGLGLVGLLQVLVWNSSGLVLLALSGDLLGLSIYQLPVSTLAWGIVYFLLGYLFYAALMASVGALVPGLREASQATFLLTLPMMAPFMLSVGLISTPNGFLAVFFSLFPMTSPLGMMLRLSTGEPIPGWQLALSIGLLAAATLLVIRLAAGLFRTQTMLAGLGLRGWFRRLLRR